MGIGHAIATTAAQAGAQVILHGMEETCENLPEGGSYISGDLTATDAASQLLDQAFALHPELSLLVCNAGSNYNAPFFEMTRERWDKTMQINLTANYFLAQEFARRLAQQERPGAIVFTGSVNGFQAELNSSAYDISKGGVVMMVRGLAMELADYKIRVNGIAPGLIYTQKTRPGIENKPGKKAHFERKILLRRIGEPEDCAGAAVFLLTGAASYITGEIIVIDGGLTISQIGDIPPRA